MKNTLNCLLLAGLALVSTATPAAERVDLAIVNARIVDGTGNPWFRGTIGIRGDRIVSVGAAPVKARRVIDARDRVVAPGFIDLMAQNSRVLVQDPDSAASQLLQGITTHVAGEGWSDAPQNARTQKDPVRIGSRDHRWTTFAEYGRILESNGLGINVVFNVGATQIREVVMGDEDRAPAAAELAEMKRLVAQAMRDGAGGVSTALIYPPAAYATTEELIELSKVAAQYGGFYSTHMRNESAGVLTAIDEALRIGREASIPVHIYHLKAAGKRNWPLMKQAIDRIEAARAQGLDVTADIYPYIRNQLDLASLIPPAYFSRGKQAGLDSLSDPEVRRRIRADLESADTSWENWYQHTGSDWDKVMVTSSGTYATDVGGLSVAKAAEKLGKNVWDTFFELSQANADCAPETMDEDQKILALRTPWIMIETDTGPVNPAKVSSTHPRAFGSFPRVLAKYVRDERVLPMEDAIRRMTTLPANRLGLRDRGRIAPGMAADLVVFDPSRIQDRATYEKPLQYSEGVDFLLINGKLAVEDGKVTRAPIGRVLRH